MVDFNLNQTIDHETEKITAGKMEIFSAEQGRKNGVDPKHSRGLETLTTQYLFSPFNSSFRIFIHEISLGPSEQLWLYF